MSEFRFAESWAFQLLWVLPLILFVSAALYRRYRKKLEAVFTSKMLGFLTSSISPAKRKLKWWLEILTVVFMVFALARPQSGKSEQKVKSEGVELMILFDVSNSMMAEDVKPSRMDLAKRELSRFLDLGGGDKVGLVAFAGSGVLLSPMTNDKAAIKMYIDSLLPSSVSSQGTYFKGALEEAQRAFKRGGSDEDEESVVTRVIVVVSDGEDNEEGALDFAKELRKEGIRIFTLGFGTEKGGAIPIRDSRGQLRGYKKNKEGQVVLTRTQGTVLKNLAQAGEGAFYHVTMGSRAVNNLKDDIDQLEKSEFDSAVMTHYDEKYQIFLFFALVLALVEIFLGQRRPLGRIWKGRFEVAEA